MRLLVSFDHSQVRWLFTIDSCPLGDHPGAIKFHASTRDVIDGKVIVRRDSDGQAAPLNHLTEREKLTFTFDDMIPVIESGGWIYKGPIFAGAVHAFIPVFGPDHDPSKDFREAREVQKQDELGWLQAFMDHVQNQKNAGGQRDGKPFKRFAYSKAAFLKIKASLEDFVRDHGLLSGPIEEETLVAKFIAEYPHVGQEPLYQEELGLGKITEKGPPLTDDQKQKAYRSMVDACDHRSWRSIGPFSVEKQSRPCQCQRCGASGYVSAHRPEVFQSDEEGSADA